MSSLRRVLVPVAVGVALVGCAKKEPPAASAPPVAVRAKAAPARPLPVPTAAQAGPLEPQRPTFLYDPTGLRDPFEPFIKLEDMKKKGAPAPKAFTPRTPLQQYPSEQLKLVGVVWGAEGRARALIEDPQGKGYAVGVGALVGDRGGKVVRIQPDRVVIEERFTDLFGEEKKNVSNIMLRKSEGEVAR